MNIRILSVCILAASTLLISCDTKKENPLVLQSEQIIETVPSASGIVCQDGLLQVVGDDAAYIFQLDAQNNIIDKYQISMMNRLQNGRISKSLKADFESMDYFDDMLLVMGSGSSKVSRDTAVLFNLKQKTIMAKVSFRPLYQEFLILGGFDSTQSINMEGLASDDHNFYLLHRGNICGKNIIFQIKKVELLHFIQTAELPHISFHSFDLPKINGYQSGFSGACVSPDKKRLIFTASVESTGDVYHDGEVLGSFIGTISIIGSQAWKQYSIYPVLRNDSVVKTKLESVCVHSYQGNQFQLIAASDNDNGKSGIYHFLLNIKN